MHSHICYIIPQIGQKIKCILKTLSNLFSFLYKAEQNSGIYPCEKKIYELFVNKTALFFAKTRRCERFAEVSAATLRWQKVWGCKLSLRSYQRHEVCIKFGLFDSASKFAIHLKPTYMLGENFYIYAKPREILKRETSLLSASLVHFWASRNEQ